MQFVLCKTEPDQDGGSHGLDHKHSIGAKLKGKKFQQKKYNTAGFFAGIEQKAHIACDGKHGGRGSELDAGNDIEGRGIYKHDKNKCKKAVFFMSAIKKQQINSKSTSIPPYQGTAVVRR